MSSVEHGLDSMRCVRGRMTVMPLQTVIGPTSMSAKPRWRGPLGLLFVAGVLLLSGCSRSPGQTEQAALLDKYCMDCHNSVDRTAELSFETLSLDAIADDAEIWEKVVRKLRGRLMPPPGGPVPTGHDLDQLVAWLEGSLDRASPQGGPGHIALHRLNRTEYANAIRDLLALEVDAANLLPVDDVEDGFDNIARALQVSPTFMEQYLDAARVLSAQAVGNASPRVVGATYTIGNDYDQLFHVEGLPLGTRGGALIEHYFPADGQYLLNIGNLATGAWLFNTEHRNTLIATLNGKKFFELDIGGGEDLKALDQLGAPAVDALNQRLKNIPFTAKAGVQRLGVTFLHRSFAESDRHLPAMTPRGGQDTVLTLSQVEILGPVEPTGLSMTPSRERVFSCYPERESEQRACAEEIVDRLTATAFRGRSSDDDVARLMQLYDSGAVGGGFEEGVKLALAGVLAHPKFLYRTEGANAAAEAAYALSSAELASRLSFFLWRTIPDEQLLALAAADELKDPATLDGQVRRMLADPRSATLASNFAYQWLEIGKLDNVIPDPFLFADVDPNIRALVTQETELFIDSIFREDRSVLDLLRAKHTFLNESLALHYGVTDIRGERFRRVELADERRAGLLGKGSVLIASSYPNRTSPVLRGAWVLKQILGTPPAEPPPGVEGLAENIAGEVATTVRARLEAHRTNPSCNGCHGVIDPLGFALENFDAVGRWRDKDREAGTPIDSSGVLADGTAVDGPLALRQAILQRPEQFVQTLTERLMTYGLGRSLEYQDMPAVRRIVRESAANEYRFSSIVLGIVSSEQFQMNGPPRASESPLTAAR